jgi:dihydrofolate reductase
LIAIVVAYSANHVIGHRGQLPWRLPSDLRRFRELTVGHTVIMGRRTFESLPPAYRPLPDRHNVVLSANPGFEPQGVEVHRSFESALAAHAGGCFVIGGSSIYRQAMPFASRIYATRVQAHTPGDAFFPQIDPADWRCVEERQPLAENDHTFIFCTYDRQA